MKYPEFVDVTKIIECGNSKYRYSLFIPFVNFNSKRKNNLVVILKNPSKASAICSDVTVSKVCNVAKNRGYNSVTILNLFPLRATNAKELRTFYKSTDFNEECNTNKCFIKNACINIDVVFAWGTNTISKSKVNENIYNTTIKETIKLILPQVKRVFYVPQKKQSKIIFKNIFSPMHAQCWSHTTIPVSLSFKKLISILECKI